MDETIKFYEEALGMKLRVISFLRTLSAFLLGLPDLALTALGDFPDAWGARGETL